MKKVNVLGVGKLGECVIDLILSENHYEAISIFDDTKSELKRKDVRFQVLGTIEDGIHKIVLTDEPFIITLGPNFREKSMSIFESLKKINRNPVSIISNKSIISSSADLGVNSIVFPGAYIGCEVKISHSLVCYSNVSLEHHIQVGHSVYFAPGVKIASGVNIGDKVFVGIGSVITNNIIIGESAVIGAGTLVLKDVEKKSLAYGMPLKILPIKNDFKL
jgi:sugar O-acyltransferase (sialic acid O-acetyltransferase NeuD family)